MESLKNNIDHISDDTKEFIQDHIKLFSIRISAKLARFLGKLSSIFIIGALIMLALAFFTFALAGYLNELMNNEYSGYLIIGGLYILIIFIILIRAGKTNKPLCSNYFARIITSALDVDVKHSNNLDDLDREREILHHKIETDKVKIKANFHSLRYVLMEEIFKSFFGLFKSKKSDEEPASQPEQTEKENK